METSTSSSLPVSEEGDASSLSSRNDGGGRDTGFQSLQSLLDEDDESDYELVSTTVNSKRQRLDRMVSSFDQKMKEDEHEEVILVSKKASAYLNRKMTGVTTRTTPPPTTKHRLFLSDDDEEDFMVVSTKATIIEKEPSGSDRAMRTNAVVCISGLVVTGLLWYYLLNKRRRRFFRGSKHVTATVASSNSPASSSSKFKASSTTPTKTVEPSTLDATAASAKSPTTDLLDDDDSKLNERLPSPSKSEPLGSTTNPEESILVKPAIPSLCSEGTDSSLSAHFTRACSVSDEEARQQTIQVAANQLAQDIKLVEQVFQEKGLDTSLASQVAVTLHSSRHLVVEQERLEMQRLMVEAHQKHLDRQLSLQEHRLHTTSTATALLYDPNWKDKLRDRRDNCWNATCRLIWEVALAHILVKLAKPVLQVVLQHSGTDDTTQYSSLSSTSRILQLLLTNLCNCDAASDPFSVRGSFTAGDDSSSWLFYATSIFDVYWHSWVWFESPSVVLEQGACYGYCLVSLGSISVVALVLHQLFRAFSAPPIVHHATNAAALWIVYGGPTTNLMDWVHSIRRERPDLVLLVATSIVGMLTVVQWNYQAHRQRVSKCSPKDFRTTWDQCQDAMDLLHFQISLTRYAALALFCGILWAQAGQNGGGGNDDSLAIVQTGDLQVVVV